MDTTIPNLTGQWGSAIWIGTEMVAYNATDNEPGAGAGNPTSNLQGWLAPASTETAGDATWNGSDMLQVKTRQPSDTPTTNTMEINGTSYPQTLASGQVGGWHLLVLNNSGQPYVNQLYPLTGGGADGATQDQLAAQLQGLGFGFTVFLQAFGTVAAPAGASNLANAIQGFGGRADVVSRFNGTADPTGGVYALIASNSKDITFDKVDFELYNAKEASFERTRTTGTLSALMIRTASRNDYTVLSSDTAAADAAGTNRYGFLPLVHQAPTDWTNWVRDGGNGSLRAPTAAENAAFQYILTQSAGWLPNTPYCANATDGIRGYYCTTNADDLNGLKTDIVSIDYNDSSDFTKTDFMTVRGTIQNEIGDVQQIRTTVSHYQALFGYTGQDGIVNAGAIGTAVSQAVAKSTTTETQAEFDNIVSALTDMASVIPGIGPEMTFISGALGLMSNLQPNTSPQVYLDEIAVTQANAATTLIAQLQAASTQLSTYGDLLVADPVKLKQGANYLLNNDVETTASNSQFVSRPSTPPSSGCGGRSCRRSTTCGASLACSGGRRPACTASRSATRGRAWRRAGSGRARRASAPATRSRTGCWASTPRRATRRTSGAGRPSTTSGRSTTSACRNRSRTRCSGARSTRRPRRASAATRAR